MAAERVIRDGNTYVRFGDKWYLIDGPLYRYIVSIHSVHENLILPRWAVRRNKLYWPYVVFDTWKRHKFYDENGFRYYYTYNGGKIPRSSTYKFISTNNMSAKP